MSLGYSWLGNELAVDFANTVIVVRPGEEIDGLATEADLARWLGSSATGSARLRVLRGGFGTSAASGRSVVPSALRRRASSCAADVAAVNRASAAAPSFAASRRRGRRRVAREQPRRRDPRRDRGLRGRAAREPDRELLRACRAPRCGLYLCRRANASSGARHVGPGARGAPLCAARAVESRRGRGEARGLRLRPRPFRKAGSL